MGKPRHKKNSQKNNKWTVMTRDIKEVKDLKSLISQRIRSFTNKICWSFQELKWREIKFVILEHGQIAAWDPNTTKDADSQKKQKTQENKKSQLCRRRYPTEAYGEKSWGEKQNQAKSNHMKGEEN